MSWRVVNGKCTRKHLSVATGPALTVLAGEGWYIACQFGRRLQWSPDRGEFVNDDEANRLRGRAYREPWRLQSLATNM